MAGYFTEDNVEELVWTPESGLKLKYLQVVTTGNNGTQDPSDAVITPIGDEKVVLFDLNNITGIKKHDFFNETIHTFPSTLIDDTTTVLANVGYVLTKDSNGKWGLTTPSETKITDVFTYGVPGNTWPADSLFSAMANTALESEGKTADAGDVVIFTLSTTKGAEARAFMYTSGGTWQELYIDNKVIGALLPDGTTDTGPTLDLSNFVLRSDLLDKNDEYWRPIYNSEAPPEFDNLIFSTVRAAAISNQPNIIQGMVDGNKGPKFIIRGGSGGVSDIRIYKSNSDPEHLVNETDPSTEQPDVYLDIGYLTNTGSDWGFKSFKQGVSGAVDSSLIGTSNSLRYSGQNQTRLEVTDTSFKFSTYSEIASSPTESHGIDVGDGAIQLRTQKDADAIASFGNISVDSRLSGSATNYIDIVSTTDGKVNAQISASSDKTMTLTVDDTVKINSKFIQLPVVSKTNENTATVGITLTEGLMYVCDDNLDTGKGSTLKIYLNGGWRTVAVQ
jgi:hypothetical protein